MRSCEFLFRATSSLLVVLVVGRCTGPRATSNDHNNPAPSQPSADGLRERALRTFERAIFYKPREESLVGLEGTLAPLIVQEAGLDAGVPPSFGAIVGELGKERIDSERPTVYFEISPTQVGNTEFEQLTYFWRFPSRCGTRRCASHNGNGVRVTLDLDGLPIVWESLSTDEGRSLLFVSRSLEDAARREFGEPLEGRAFSIERAANETRNVVVVRLLDDGPVAMGPYVYLESPPSADVTTILCRCMPSQVSEFVESRYYNLVPMDFPWMTPPRPRSEFGARGSKKHLDVMLRWPREYR